MHKGGQNWHSLIVFEISLRQKQKGRQGDWNESGTVSFEACQLFLKTKFETLQTFVDLNPCWKRLVEICKHVGYKRNRVIFRDGFYNMLPTFSRFERDDWNGFDKIISMSETLWSENSFPQFLRKLVRNIFIQQIVRIILFSNRISILIMQSLAIRPRHAFEILEIFWAIWKSKWKSSFKICAQNYENDDKILQKINRAE